MNTAELALSHSDVVMIATGAATPNCPKCGGQSTALVRQGKSLLYKCASCDESFRVMFAMSDITQLKDADARDADTLQVNCNVKIVGKLTQP